MHREVREESVIFFQIIFAVLALIGPIYILRRFLLKKYNEFMKKSEEILKLNVGGTMFHTRKETILCFYDKLSPPDKDGIIFIDRSPKTFDYILNYLRNHPTTLPPIFPESILSQLSQQLIDSLTCPICLGTFQGTPLVLQCGHSFCATCINGLKRSLRRNQCPVCRKNVDFNDAHKNYALQSLLDSVNAIPSDSFQVGDTMYHQLRRQLDQLREQRAELRGQRDQLLRQRDELLISYVIIFYIAIFGILIFWKFYVPTLPEPKPQGFFCRNLMKYCD